MISIAELSLLSLVNRFGSDATAAYGAGTQIISYVQFPAMSIAITASILGAQAIGAGRPDRLDAITRTGLWLNVAISGLLVVVALLFSRAVVGLFTRSAAVIDLTQSLLHISLWSSVVFGMASVFAGVMRASGTVSCPPPSPSWRSRRWRCRSRGCCAGTSAPMASGRRIRRRSSRCL